MLKRLSEMLSPMQGKNVDILVEFNGNIVMSISTERFDCSIDDLHLIIGNDCMECQFESKFIIDDIVIIDDTDYEEEGTVVITIEDGIRLHLTKI